jgi:hypothetical protein
MRFTIRDLLWLMVVELACAWWLHHLQCRKEIIWESRAKSAAAALRYFGHPALWTGNDVLVHSQDANGQFNLTIQFPESGDGKIAPFVPIP